MHNFSVSVVYVYVIFMWEFLCRFLYFQPFKITFFESPFSAIFIKTNIIIIIEPYRRLDILFDQRRFSVKPEFPSG